MRILVAGSFKYDFYDEACANALEQLGHQVIHFAWQRYYGRGLTARLQQKWLIGSGIKALNRDLHRLACNSKPDALFITRGIPIWPTTLRMIKRDTDALLLSYNNDDPFGANTGMRLWKHFVDSIPVYDLHFVFRALNIPEYQHHGATSVQVLMPYYLPNIHYPIVLDEQDINYYGSDLVFIGHAKADNRIEYLRTLANAGYQLKLYGWHWERFARYEPWIAKHNLAPVWNLDYTRAIRASKVALVFFSRQNRDTYTSRSFEIPAIGTSMLSERTSDMLEMFREDQEATYFSSSTELLEKTAQLLNDKKRRLEIANRAQERVHELKASVSDRMEQVVAAIYAYQGR